MILLEEVFVICFALVFSKLFVEFHLRLGLALARVGSKQMCMSEFNELIQKKK